MRTEPVTGADAKGRAAQFGVMCEIQHEKE